MCFFASSRAPGGTLGNRNFVAHAAAFGLPICFLAALRAQRTATYVLASIGIAIVTASLVLSRSRAAWLAFAVMFLIFFFGSLKSWGRLAGVVVFAAAGVGAALLLPNTLHWRSENPYLESVRGVANYEEGSGRGRLEQYGRSPTEAALQFSLRERRIGVNIIGMRTLDHLEHCVGREGKAPLKAAR